MMFSDLSNNAIEEIPNDGRIVGLDFAALLFSHNKLTTLQPRAFANCRIHFLALDHNPLISIHSNTFAKMNALHQVDLSYTKIVRLDSVDGLQQLRAIKLQGNYNLKALPSAFVFPNLQLAHLTYAHHCCYFWMAAVRDANVSKAIKCSPKPNALNPCEDMTGHLTVRILVWLEWLLAVVGNSVVLLRVVVGRHLPNRFTCVGRLLVSNLALADLCTGVYLAILAVQDLRTAGRYFNYAVDWQTGIGCQLAGFFAVFASELSVSTILIISYQMWYNTRAAFYGFHFHMRMAMRLQAGAWLAAALFAALPLFNVNNYTVTSVCLPLRLESHLDKAYLIGLLTFNAIAFAHVTFNYVHTYCMVSGGKLPAAQTQDWCIATKMALLIFTNFACWIPTIVLGMCAAAGRPLVGISASKYFLVLAYPINATADPFLYALSASGLLAPLRRCCSKIYQTPGSFNKQPLDNCSNSTLVSTANGQFS